LGRLWFFARSVKRRTISVHFHPHLQKEDEEKAQLARVAAEEQLKKQEEERRNIRILPGDYQVQVNVIEARNLKPEDLGGTSDPVVYAKVWGSLCMGPWCTRRCGAPCVWGRAAGR
jgi:hypothetical protein